MQLMMLRLEIERDEYGWEWCLKLGIGAMRKRLGLPPEGVRLTPTGVATTDEGRPYGEIGQSSRVMLSEACHHHCLLACPLRER